MITNSNTDTAVALVTPMISGSSDHDDACDRSLLVRSMYASSSGSYIIERERECRNRPKPPPPAKPATLKNKIACGGIQCTFPQISKLDVSTANESLPKVLSNTIDSSKRAREGRKNHGGKVISTSEDTTTESSSLFETRRITDLYTEEFKRVECEPPILESTERSNARTTIINKRTSFINEEIKKPKMKPPPPPTQSLVHPSHSARGSSKIETIRKKLNLEGISNTNQDNTLNNVDGDESAPPKAHRFERCLDSWHIPSVPSIPPPLPPVLSPHDPINDAMYEEIEQLTYTEENGEIYKTKAIDEQIDEVLMQEANYDKSGQNESLIHEEENKLNDSNDNCSSSNHFGTTLRMSDEEKYYVKNKESNLWANERTVTMRRPKSALEFDKLLRIKSDIQLNITKKVGQIKFKVSSASQERQRCKRPSSILYIDREKFKNHNDDKVLAKIDFPLDEQCIYGDVWSSDEDDYIGATQQKQGNF
ncbi:hypothetical protein LOAG_17846 [Loa loa]|uniref:Uncharacterized protein n=1 Tax=Loa loa TaxID=7209 RepID=A0A1S0UHH4_LOALO|nr:hypothetical protein LOAG_17846 [Loa loa]EJD74911.1 hypothetical protein LOAG_17846 [Loa loa]